MLVELIKVPTGCCRHHCNALSLWCTTLGAANKLKHLEASCIFFPVVLQIFLSDLAPSLFYSANRMTGGLLSALLSTDNTMASLLHYDALHGGAHKLQHLVSSYIWLSHGITNAEVIYSTLVKIPLRMCTWESVSCFLETGSQVKYKMISFNPTKHDLVGKPSYMPVPLRVYSFSLGRQPANSFSLDQAGPIMALPVSQFAAPVKYQLIIIFRLGGS